MEESVVHCPRCGAANRLKSPAPDQTPVCGKCKSSLPWVLNATDISFRKELETAVPVLVDFWANGARLSRYAPVLEEVARDRAGRSSW